MREETYLNPFPGLRSFEEEEEYLFFGREKQIDELLGTLGKTRFLAVVGASGSGKSSLVKSGLLPSLHSGYLSGAGSGWRISTFRPGNDPIGNLAEALSSREVLASDNNELPPAAFVESLLRRSDQGICESIRQLGSDHKQNVLLVVDQFEELFRFSKYEKAKQKGTRDAVTFINLLIAASRFPGIPVYVVLTMRSDFLGDCTEFRGLPEAINEGLYLVPRMTREERKAAITGPIAVGGATISQALLTRLLNDVGDNPDQLPILQHALMRTWDHWRRHKKPEEPVGLDDYEATGTMTKALSLHAEEAYKEIGDDEGKEACKKIFRSLTEKRDDGRGIRRPTIMREICELADISLSEATRIIDIFRAPGRSFLMPPANVQLTGETVIDISHESLMRVWERLIIWVKEEIESAELYTRLSRSAALYQEGKTGVWRDPELLMAVKWRQFNQPNRVWAQRYDPSFDRAMSFLSYSEAEKNRELTAAEKKRKAAIARLRMFLTFITLAFLLAVYFGIDAYRNAKQAYLSEQLALEKKVEADSSNRIAIIERDNAARERDIAAMEKEKAEHSSLLAHQQKKIAEEAFKQARTSLAIAEIATQRAEDSAQAAGKQRKEAMISANIARVETKKAVEAKKEVDRLRLLAEAKNIALKSSQLVNDAGKDTLSLQLAFLSYAVNRSLDGPKQSRVIYSALKDQMTRYYNKSVRARKDLKFVPGQYDERVIQFTGDAQFVTAGDGGSIRRWELGGSPPELRLTATSKNVLGDFTSLNVKDDRSSVLAGTSDGRLYIWSLRESDAPVAALKEANKIIYAGWLKGGELCIVVTAKKIAVYKLDRSGSAPEPLHERIFPGDAGAVCRIDKNGVTELVTGVNTSLYFMSIGADGNIAEPAKLADMGERVTALAVTGDGGKLAAGGALGNISLYKRAGTGHTFVSRQKGNLSAVTGLAFSRDASLLVSGSLDHSVRVIRPPLAGGDEDLVLKEKDAWVRNVAISPDSRYAVAVGQSGLLQWWPLQPDQVLEEIRKITPYAGLLNGPVNAAKMKEVLGEDLYNSIGDLEPGNKSFDMIWQGLQEKYLN